MPTGISIDSISAKPPAFQVLQNCSINSKDAYTPVFSNAQDVSSKPQVTNDATNKMIERYSFKKDEVKRNTQYSQEKIALSYADNAKEKRETASLSVHKKSGLVQINLKKDITLKELKALYNIQDGILKHYNELPYESSQNGDDFDKGVLQKGEAVLVPPSSFEYQGRIIELWHALTR